MRRRQGLGADQSTLLVRGEGQHDRVLRRRRREPTCELDQERDRGGVVDRAGAALDGVVVGHHEQRLAAAARTEAHEQVGIARGRTPRRPVHLAEHLDRGQVDRADRHALDGDRGSEARDDVVGGRPRRRAVSRPGLTRERVDVREHAVDVESRGALAGGRAGEPEQEQEQGERSHARFSMPRR